MMLTVFLISQLITISKSLSFDIEINGRSSNMTTFCVGDNITLFCSGGTGSFTWTIPSLSNSLGVTLGSPVETDSMMRFTAQRLSTHISSLMFTAFSELMNSNITCADGGNGMILSTAVLGILGLPSSPDVTVMHPLTNPTNLNLNITETGASAVCVKEYRVTIDPPGNTTPVPATSSTIESEVSANLKICGISPSVSVVAVDRGGRESQPTVPSTVDIATSGYDPYSGIVEGEFVLLNPTSFFNNCILGNNYIFENIMNGTDSNTKISLEHLEDRRRTCKDCILIVTPIFDSSSGPITIFNISINISLPGIGLVITITKETMTTPIIECESESQGQHYLGALIGVIIAALVIIIVLTLVIILLAVKVKSLKSKIVVTNTENEEVQYDKVTNNNKQKFKKDTYSLTKGDAGIAMVGCEAYGKVSVQPQVQSAGQHGEGAAGVYEVV